MCAKMYYLMYLQDCNPFSCQIASVKFNDVINIGKP